MVEIGFWFSFALLQNVFSFYQTASVEVMSMVFITVFRQTLLFCDAEKLLEKEHIKQ